MSFTVEQVLAGFSKAGACSAPSGYDSCFDYGTFILGEAPFTREFAIHNPLRVALVIDSLDFSTLTPALWSLDASECRGRTLQPGESCVIRLTFIPPPKPGVTDRSFPCTAQLNFNPTGALPQSLTFHTSKSTGSNFHVTSKTFDSYTPGAFSETDTLPAVLLNGVSYSITITQHTRLQEGEQARLVVRYAETQIADVLCAVVGSGQVAQPTAGGGSIGGTHGGPIGAPEK